MGTKKKFTPEELKHLQANPYTLRVTADSISYTLAFKEAFWALSLQGYPINIQSYLHENRFFLRS